MYIYVLYVQSCILCIYYKCTYCDMGMLEGMRHVFWYWKGAWTCLQKFCRASNPSHSPYWCQTLALVRTIPRLCCIVQTASIRNHKLLVRIIIMCQHCSKFQHTSISEQLVGTTSNEFTQDGSIHQLGLGLNKSFLLFIFSLPLLIQLQQLVQRFSYNTKSLHIPPIVVCQIHECMNSTHIRWTSVQ